MTGTRELTTRTFVRSVVGAAHFLKNGKGPTSGLWEGTRSFAMQKAKAIRLSEYSFPVFLIRRPRQRGSYSSDVGKGGPKSPSTKKAMKLK